MRYPGVLLFAIMMAVPAWAEETGISGAVARSAFTTHIVEREPADEIVTVANNTYEAPACQQAQVIGADGCASALIGNRYLQGVCLSIQGQVPPQTHIESHWQPA